MKGLENKKITYEDAERILANISSEWGITLNSSCRSCGWNALFHEHGVGPIYIIEAFANGTASEYEISCANSDISPPERYSHRGIVLDLNKFLAPTERTD